MTPLDFANKPYHLALEVILAAHFEEEARERMAQMPESLYASGAYDVAMTEYVRARMQKLDAMQRMSEAPSISLSDVQRAIDKGASYSPENSDHTKAKRAMQALGYMGADK